MKNTDLISGFLLLWLNSADCANVCPGTTTKSTTVATTLDPNECDHCSRLFALQWNNYLFNGKEFCILDVLAVTTCFDQCRGEDTFFYLIGTALDYLYEYNDIDTNAWSNYQDVMDTYYEKCPDATRPTTPASSLAPTSEPIVAYFLNLDTSISISSDMNIGATVYTIETNDDSVTLKYGIIMKTDSKYFQLSSFNELKLLVRNKLVAGLIHILEFEIVYKHSCGPGALTISVEDTLLPSSTAITLLLTTAKVEVETSSTAPTVLVTLYQPKMILMASTPMKREGSRGGHFDDTATVAIVSATVGCLVLIVASLAFYYLVSRNGSFSRTGQA